MKLSTRRFLALLLALALAFSLGATAWAAENEDEDPDLFDNSDNSNDFNDFDDTDDTNESDPLSNSNSSSTSEPTPDPEPVYDDVAVEFYVNSTSLDVGESLSLYADVSGGSGSYSFQWSSSSTPAGVVSVSGNGTSATVTAATAGTAQVTLTVTDSRDGSNSDTAACTITVSESVEPLTISKTGSNTGASLGLDVGATARLSVQTGGGTDPYVEWETNTGNVHLDSYFDESVTLTADSSGSDTVTCTVYDFAGGTPKSVTWSVTVNASRDPELTVSLDKSSMSLSNAQRTGTLSVTAGGGSGSYQYTWRTEGGSSVSVENSGSTGTTVTMLGTGTTTVCVDVYDGKVQKTAKCIVTVANETATGDATGSVSLGSTLNMGNIAQTISSKYSAAFGSGISGGASVRLNTASSSAGILKLSSGNAISGGSNYSYADLLGMYFQPSNAGSFSTAYTITDGGNTITGTIRIDVSGGNTVTSASLSRTSMTLSTYSSQFLNLTVNPSNASYSVAWSSSNTNIATVNGSGLSATVQSNGREGNCVITARVTSNGQTIDRTCNVYVESSSTYNPSVTITMGSDYYGTTASDAMSKQFRSIFGYSLNAQKATIRFSSLGNTRYAESFLSNGTAVRTGTSYTFQEFIDMYTVPYAAGSCNMSYSLSQNGDTLSGTLYITIRASGLTVASNISNLTLTAGSSQTARLTITPANSYYTVSWSTTNSNVAQVVGSGTSVTVTAPGTAGTATVTAVVTDRSGVQVRKNISVTVTNSGGNYNPSLSLTLGQNWVGTGTYDSLVSQFRSRYNATINDSTATIRFGATGDTRIATTRLSNGNPIQANTDYTMAQYKAMYVEPYAAGSYTVPYTLSFSGKTLTGNVNISVSAAALNLNLRQNDLGSHALGESFNGTVGASYISQTITNSVGAWSYLRFSNVGNSVGTLYQNSQLNALSTTANISASSLNNLYFVPAKAGTYTCNFNVYSSGGAVMANGVLTIVIPGSQSAFVDVAQSAYYYDAVNWAVEKNVTTGVDETHFQPAWNVTRAQAVTFLWRAKGSPAVNNAANPFVDVPAGEYYYHAVLWAVQQGITAGIDETHFDPNGSVHNDMMLTFTCRAEGGYAGGADWSSLAYAWAQGRGLLNGIPTTYNATSDCPRSDVVFFLWRDLA